MDAKLYTLGTMDFCCAKVMQVLSTTVGETSLRKFRRWSLDQQTN